LKRIFFNNISSWKNGILILSALLCFMLSSLELLPEPYASWNKKIYGIGSVFMIIFFLKMLVGRYYVGWNRIGITIRISSFIGKSFNFKDVKSTNIVDNILTVTKREGKQLVFDLSQIRTKDIEKLTDILVEHTVANNLKDLNLKQ